MRSGTFNRLTFVVCTWTRGKINYPQTSQILRYKSNSNSENYNENNGDFLDTRKNQKYIDYFEYVHYKNNATIMDQRVKRQQTNKQSTSCSCSITILFCVTLYLIN